jgi:hypothetical protein
MAEGADRNFLWRNLAVRCGRFTARDRGVNELLDNHALAEPIADSGLAISDLGPQSAIRNPQSAIARAASFFPFRPIPWPEIGLYPDEFRASWPVKHDITPHYVSEH